MPIPGPVNALRGDGRGEVGLVVGRGRLKLATPPGVRHLPRKTAQAEASSDSS